MSDATQRTATVRLPWPDRRCNPNARGHWSRRAAGLKADKAAAWGLTAAAGVRLDDGRRHELALLFCPPDRRARDLDNMLAAAKGLLDGFALAAGVDDSKFALRISVGDPIEGGAVILKVAV